jgi:hypothetical protein
MGNRALSNLAQERVFRVGITGTGAAAPTKRYGPGVTVTYIGTGIYRFTFATHPGTFLDFTYGLRDSTPGDVKAHTVHGDTYVVPADGAAGYIELTVFDGASAQDLATGELLGVTFYFTETTADLVAHVSDAEILEGIDEVYGDFYLLHCDGAGSYFQTTHEFSADGSDSYNEPDDHLSTIQLDLIGSDGSRTPLGKLLAQERYKLAGEEGDPCAYSIIDDQIVLYPNPSSADLELLYIPQPPDITEYVTTDVIDVVHPYGAHFVVYGVAALVLAKSESDERTWLNRQARAEKRCIEWAAKRAFHDSMRRYVPDEGDDE